MIQNETHYIQGEKTQGELWDWTFETIIRNIMQDDSLKAGESIDLAIEGTRKTLNARRDYLNGTKFQNVLN